MKVTVADLGIGNLHSLRNGLERAGAHVDVTRDPTAWPEARALVLPGVGSFGAGARTLGGAAQPLRARLEAGMPTLGVCLGLQLLLEGSDESSEAGIGFIRGRVRHFPPAAGKVPHMGWSRVEHEGDPILAGIPSGEYFYFVHSYYPDPAERVGVATAQYGARFPAVLRKANTVATQFHPEKSGPSGLGLLKNFIAFAEAHQ